MNLKEKLHFVRNEIDKSFIREDNNYCVYGFFCLWWLETVLNMAGYNSHRMKIRYLRRLWKTNRLLQFYEMIGNPAIARIPSLATWTEYKEAINHDFDWNVENHRMFLTEMAQNLSNLFPKDAKKLGVNLPIDGKDIRHSKIGKTPNIKVIQGVSQNVLLFSDIVKHESTWIKDEMEQTLVRLMARFPNVQFCITGDCIYNNRNVRKMLYGLEIDFLLPIKSSNMSRFRSKILEKRGIAIAQKKCFRQVFVRFIKQEKVVDIVTLTPILQRGITAALHIDRTVSSTELTAEELTSYQEDLLFVCSTKEECSQELLNGLYATKLAHWQVETYHQKKDVLLDEDRHHKAPTASKSGTRMRDFILHLIRRLYGGTTKRVFESFRFELDEAIFGQFLHFFYNFSFFCCLEPTYWSQR